MEIYSQLYFVLLEICSVSFVFRECVSVMFTLPAAVAKLIELHFIYRLRIYKMMFGFANKRQICYNIFYNPYHNINLHF